MVVGVVWGVSGCGECVGCCWAVRVVLGFECVACWGGWRGLGWRRAGGLVSGWGGRVAGRVAGWRAGGRVSWLAGELAGWWAGWLAGELGGGLAGWWAGELAGVLAG